MAQLSRILAIGLLYVISLARMGNKNDWVIWKSDEKTLVLRAGIHPHLYIEKHVHCEIVAKLYSVTEKMADAVRKTLFKEWSSDRPALMAGIGVAVSGLSDLHDSLEDGICLPEDQCQYCTLQWRVIKKVGDHSG